MAVSKEDILEAIAAAHEGNVVLGTQTAGGTLWTDDFSNIFSVMK